MSGTDSVTQSDSPRTPERQKSYLGLISIYGAATAALVGIGATRRKRIEVPRPLDIAMMGMATHKLSRLITKDVVTTPIRAPFTEFQEHGNPGEVNEQAKDGSGLRHVVGELVSCPFCTDMWVATGLTAATMLTPKLGRSATALLCAVGVADFLQFGYSAANKVAEG